MAGIENTPLPVTAFGQLGRRSGHIAWIMFWYKMLLRRLCQLSQDTAPLNAATLFAMTLHPGQAALMLVARKCIAAPHCIRCHLLGAGLILCSRILLHDRTRFAQAGFPALVAL